MFNAYSVKYISTVLALKSQKRYVDKLVRANKLAEGEEEMLGDDLVIVRWEGEASVKRSIHICVLLRSDKC
jgi:hypothetical protein